MSTIDDKALIKKFIKGKVRLAFNHNLRVEPVSTTIQLSTKKGCLLATVNLANNLKSFFVRRDTEYWQLINKVLLENSFMPISKTKQGLFKYEQRFVPPGYGMNYTEARILWKTWRIRKNQNLDNDKISDLKIETKQGWETIQVIELSQENVFVKTATGELMLHISDCLVWISLSDTTSKQVIQENNNPIKESLEDTFQNDSAVESDALFWTQFETEKNQKDKVKTDSETCSDKNQNILNIYQGKLYIQTVEGEIVVEGSNLKFWFTPPEGQNFVPEPIKVEDFDKPRISNNISNDEFIINL
ncbi:MAG: hypothetical protein AAF378_05645 [Cyanobacteria bacterium P01_A01_bin.84]